MQDTSALKVIGLMSGTSVDGIDAALVEIQGTGLHAKIKLTAYKCYPYASKMREAILNASNPEESRTDTLSALNFALGELFAAAAIDIAHDAGINILDVDLIGSHGQTIWHSPDQVEVGGMWAASTLQVGEPSVIAERTSVTVVADFRTADMAAGGQGAPLVPYADFVLFRSTNRSRAVQNIGGIGNVTYIPAGGRLNQIVAFDTGPGNMLIDAVVSRLTDGKLTCDEGGKLALVGKPDRVILGRLLKHPFLQKRPPKSTGREEFGMQFAEQLLSDWPQVSLEDMAATLTVYTAQSIARSYERWLPKMPDDVIVGGGGTKNPALMRMLIELLPRTKTYVHEDFGIDSDAKEALAFALLASEAVHAQPANVPAATGAKRSTVLGKIVPGGNFRTLMSKVNLETNQEPA